jgi:hypothetical protein
VNFTGSVVADTPSAPLNVLNREVNPELSDAAGFVTRGGGGACTGAVKVGISTSKVRNNSVKPPRGFAAGVLGEGEGALCAATGGLSTVAGFSCDAILIRSNNAGALSALLSPSTTLCTVGSASGCAPFTFGWANTSGGRLSGG